MGEETNRPDGAEVPGEADTPVFDTLVEMTLNAFERSGLTAETYLLTRIAALVATGASPPRTCSTSGRPTRSAYPWRRSRAPSWPSPPSSAAPAW